MSQTHNKKIPSWLIEKISKEIEVENLAENTEYIPQRFEDSTHDLWRLESKQGNYFLKVCSNTGSPFWQIMQQLFGVDLLQDIQHFEKLYGHISALSSLQISELIKAESISQQGAYILTPELEGTVPDDLTIHPQMIEQLAQHLGALHKDQHSHWGQIHKPLFNNADWQQRLKETIEKSAQKWGGDQTKYNTYLESALESCRHINCNTFVPQMLDLRWDQFLQADNKLSALIDLDAFVFAPRELDFVLLEYILSPEQLDQFIKLYAQHHLIPDLSKVRPAYRLLLFYMQVLGELDIDAWMNAPERL